MLLLNYIDIFLYRKLNFLSRKKRWIFYVDLSFLSQLCVITFVKNITSLQSVVHSICNVRIIQKCRPKQNWNREFHNHVQITLPFFGLKLKTQSQCKRFYTLSIIHLYCYAFRICLYQNYLFSSQQY